MSNLGRESMIIEAIISPEEVDCNIDEDIDNEHCTSKNINNSFINRLKDFSAFNPSGNKGKEKGNNSVLVPYGSRDVNFKRDSILNDISNLDKVDLTD